MDCFASLRSARNDGCTRNSSFALRPCGNEDLKFKSSSLRVKRSNPNLKKFYTKWIASGDAFAMTIENNFAILNLVKSFLTSINFDSLPKENKNPCLVINKN